MTRPTQGQAWPRDESGSGFTNPMTTDGDLITQASGVPDRVGIGSTGQVLTVVGGAPAWAAAGGGGSLPFPDVPPTSPHTEDDEFDSASLNAKWTVVGTAPSGGNSYDIDTTAPSWLYLHGNGSGGNDGLYISQTYAPGAGVAFQVTAKFSVMGNKDYIGAFLWLTDNNTPSNGYRMGLEHRSGNPQLYVDYISGGSFTYGTQTLDPKVLGGTIYLKVTRTSGGTWRFFYSYNGISWSPMGAGISPVSPTVGKLILSVEGGGSTGDPYFVGCDWVRRDWVNI